MPGHSGDALPRYNFVWLDPHLQDEAILGNPAVGSRRFLVDWIATGHPAIVRRLDPSCGSTNDGVPLAVSSPLDVPNRRHAFAVRPSRVSRSAPPPRLADALEAAPPAWQPMLSELAGELALAGLDIRVHGSLAWEHLTGRRYLRPGSDVDLLIYPQSGLPRPELSSILGRMAAWTAPRLDGEVIFNGEVAVSWRELTGASTNVLVRIAGEARLESRAHLHASLAGISG